MKTSSFLATTCAKVQASSTPKLFEIAPRGTDSVQNRFGKAENEDFRFGFRSTKYFFCRIFTPDCAMLCSNRVPECGAWTWKKREPMAGYCYLKQTLDIGRNKYYRRDSDKYVSGFATVANQTHCRGNDFNRDSIFDLEKDLQGCWELADNFVSDETKLHYCQPARESGCYQLTCTETFVEGSSTQQHRPRATFN